jgi:long-subunit acyl-CoA synthetase (AMP-forming)
MPGLECKIIDINGNDCLRDEPGELVTKGWNVFLGYVNDEIATKNSFTEDGYFKTGDMALVRKDEALRLV